MTTQPFPSTIQKGKPLALTLSENILSTEIDSCSAPTFLQKRKQDNTKCSLSLLHISSYWQKNWKWQLRNRRFRNCCILRSHLHYHVHIVLLRVQGTWKSLHQMTENGSWLGGCFGLFSELLELLIVISTNREYVTGHSSTATVSLQSKFDQGKKTEYTFHSGTSQ